MSPQPTQSHERANFRPKSQKFPAEEKAKMMTEIIEKLGKIGIIRKLPGQAVVITPEEALKHFLDTGCNHMLEELTVAMASTDQALTLVGVTHGLEQRFEPAGRGKLSRQAVKKKAEFMKQAKKDLLRLGISIRIPMDGAMTYLTPIEAIEYLETKGSVHKMTYFTEAISKTAKGLVIVYEMELAEKVSAILEKGRTGCDRLN